jgi:hypothetical protein
MNWKTPPESSWSGMVLRREDINCKLSTLVAYCLLGMQGVVKGGSECYDTVAITRKNVILYYIKIRPA